MPQLQAETDPVSDDAKQAPRGRVLSEVAKRALAEAEARRIAETDAAPLAKEIGGRDGLDPVRFGDWEKKGIAIDF